jgi:hypothetical protein
MSATTSWLRISQDITRPLILAPDIRAMNHTLVILRRELPVLPAKLASVVPKVS